MPAACLGLPRQKVDCHLKELERHGLVELVEERRKGNVNERVYRATFGIDAEVRFASAADRAAFAEELAQAVAVLVSRYHDESAPGGRSHRVIVGLHQIPAALPGVQESVAGPPPGGMEKTGAGKENRR